MRPGFCSSAFQEYRISAQHYLGVSFQDAFLLQTLFLSLLFNRKDPPTPITDTASAAHPRGPATAAPTKYTIPAAIDKPPPKAIIDQSQSFFRQ